MYVNAMWYVLVALWVVKYNSRLVVSGTGTGSGSGKRLSSGGRDLNVGYVVLPRKDWKCSPIHLSRILKFL